MMDQDLKKMSCENKRAKYEYEFRFGINPHYELFLSFANTVKVNLFNYEI